jgi:hypothetical protein
MAFTEGSYKDLTYKEALAVLDREISIIDPALIFAARKKAKEALIYMIVKEESYGTDTGKISAY